MIVKLEIEDAIHCAPTKNRNTEKGKYKIRYWPRNIPGNNKKENEEIQKIDSHFHGNDKEVTGMT